MFRSIKKRFLSIMMVVAMLVSILPTIALAAESDYTHLLGNANVKKPSVAGALQVLDKNGVKTLSDKNGDPIQLRGMSTHGLQWFPQILNNNAFAALSNDWGSNVIRLAMYVAENGYATDPVTMKQRVIDGINLAIANDMYVLVDWHVLNPGDPNASIYSDAMKFFTEISSLYPNDEHIIYELANEPNGNNPGVTNDAAGWAQVKSYAEPIIKMLRDSGNKNLVVVGNPNWSQRPDLAADNPISDSNTVYTVHFYTGTHMSSTDSTDRSNVMSNARYAIEHGVAIFASEWGTSEASGNNGPFLNEADSWLDFLNANNVSWCNWSLTNKNETSAAFTSFEMGKTEATNLDPGDDQVWSLPELSVSGEYIRARIKGISYMPIDRTPKQAYTTTIWDFNDGTTQKFAVNSGSPNQSIVTANANNTLKVSGLAVDPGNYWGNRISADGVGVDITGAEKMTMDVITDAPATVNIGVVAQGPANGYWTSPTRAAQAIPGNFVKQDDGKYKATLTVTKDDAPGLNLIGSNSDPKLTGVVLLIGSSTDAIYLDNIAVSGNRAVVEPPVIHDPLGTPTLPSDFEDSTRQGWNWSGDSGVKTALTIKDANGSKALSWEYSYPDVKPTDNWASAPRLDFWMDNLVLGDNKYVTFDLYMSPVRVSKGAIDINLVFQPPTLGYWAQAQKTYKIQLDNLSTAEKTADGLYHFMVTLDASSVPNIAPDTMLRNMMFIFADVDSDFAGRMYVDNVKFQKEYTVNVGTLTGGTITADPAAGIAGTTVNLTVTPDVGYKLKDGSLKYNDGAKDTAITGTSFIMPAANVTVSAVFEKIFYAVKIGALTNGKITASTSSAVMGTTVNLTVAPARGYRLKAGTLKYNDGIQDVAINGTSFVMPAANVTVTAEFERDIYKVSVASTAGGTIIAFPTWAEPGQTVFVIVVPNKGYHMKPGSLMYNNGTRDVSIKGFYFRMPASNVTITAQFVRGNGK